jgi:F-type H+-transporting ATPase subunit b
VKRPLTGHLENRSDEVKKALEEAAKAKAEAEAAAREYEDRLSKLDGEIDALKADFKSRGEAELKRFEEAGKAQAARILKDAEDTINAEVEKAQNELKAEASRLSIELAEERIAKALDNKDHDRLTKAFLDDIAA